MAAWPYSSRRWQRVRERQLAREPLCRVCGGLATDVDHIRPWKAGGSIWDAANLQSLCQRCHAAKSSAVDKQGKDWRTWEIRGSNVHGEPLDPAHPWYDDVAAKG